MMQSHTASEYADQLGQLMPIGLAWSRQKDTPNDLLLRGAAEELARIDGRAVYLCLKEFYAQTTRELLPEWEFEYGLPDPCRELGASYQERIEDLLRKIRSIGGQSIQYFVDLAKSFGIDIEIEEFRPFRADMNRAGDRVYGPEWLFVFLVTTFTDRVYYFRAGQNTAGERLRYWRTNEILECIINRLKPAHTLALFGYINGDSILGRDGTGDAFIRDRAKEYEGSLIFGVDESGNVYVRNDIGAGAEDLFAKREDNGEVTLFDE